MGNRLENDRDYRVLKGEREWKGLGMKQGVKIWVAVSSNCE